MTAIELRDTASPAWGEPTTREEFGPYRLGRLIGRGGMGEVFAAHDLEMDRGVALKRLLPHAVDDAEFRARFRRESRLASRVGNPHVIPIHRSGEIDGRLFIDMRLVEGEDLDQVLTREHRLAPRRAVAVVEQVAGALDAAHHAGLIHRDVKPSNVLLDSAVGVHDFVYLVDFGVTRTIGADSQSLTATDSVVGSLDYMAPEQFAGVLGPEIDVYALGCLLFQTLTGSKPFAVEGGLPALMQAHLSAPVPLPSRRLPDLGTAFDDVVVHALAKDPAERFRSAGALAAAARAALPRPVPAPPRPTAVLDVAAPSTTTRAGRAHGDADARPTLVVAVDRAEPVAPSGSRVAPKPPYPRAVVVAAGALALVLCLVLGLVLGRAVAGGGALPVASTEVSSTS